MNDTVAKIISSILVGIGTPAQELLSPKEVTYKVFSILRRRLLQRAQSDQNLDSRSYDFYPSERDTDLSGVADLDMGTPLWIERQISSSTDVWDIVPIINIDSIEEARLRGDMRASFYNQEGRLHLKLSYIPSGSYAHRLWYHPNSILAQTLEDQTSLPYSFNDMIVDEGIVKCLPILMMHAADLETEENPVTKAQVSAWVAVGAEARDSLKEWDKLYQNHVFQSRDAQRGRNRRSILGNRSGGAQ